ncbi:unnamed protein product [Rotaria sordida]|uniref:Uncharacterized protein n=1 Tax=Rotaria sordida TaxID=392033 RepID=A0A815QTW0_9BILA|nr:unnamed protein product [Rotaria sordida]CAF4093771.1 unnamed protein product [Rotaria sordida]
MKRLERLGSVAFFTVTASLVFHLIGMSYNSWRVTTCHNCDPLNPLASWRTSVRQRCYDAGVAALFLSNDTSSRVSANAFLTQVCIPNQFLIVDDPNEAFNCLINASRQPDLICLSRRRGQNCKCDYTKRTKAVLAMTVLAALSLGILMFLSHLVAFVKIDYILRWLIPLCFVLLLFSILCIVVAISAAGGKLDEDLYHLRSRWAAVEEFSTDGPINENWEARFINLTHAQYDVKVGWCFGMEILALYFSLVSLVIYALMFFAKSRPDPREK